MTADQAREVALAAIEREHGPAEYALQAEAGNWPIWRVALAAARMGATKAGAASIARSGHITPPAEGGGDG